MRCAPRSGPRRSTGSVRLTIEHVLPQTPTQEWLDVLAEDGGDPAERHKELLHTLGNLTLTAVNATLSNHPFQRKQDLLSVSHLELNRQIAGTSRWGAKEILARAEDLADRAIRLWPGPAEVHQVEKARDWSLLHRALAALPMGAWTTYGEVATLIDSHPRPGLGHLPLGRHRSRRDTGRVARRWRSPG
ncbi:HNH endonuclease family protein [Crossiella cryophila]